MIKTYHGSFETSVDKYLVSGQSSTYLQRIGEFDGEGTFEVAMEIDVATGWILSGEFTHAVEGKINVQGQDFPVKHAQSTYLRGTLE